MAETNRDPPIPNEKKEGNPLLKGFIIHRFSELYFLPFVIVNPPTLQ